jgi:hypothetical protein
MKHTLIIIVLSAFIVSVGAKTLMNRSDSGKFSILQRNNPFRSTELSMQSNTVQFTGLPKNSAEMRIIDAYGNIAFSGQISREKSTIDPGQLPDGRYTIVLKQGTSVKMFGYYTDLVVKGVRQ